MEKKNQAGTNALSNNYHENHSPKKKSNWIRVIFPAAIILLWLTAASFGGPLFGRVSEVSSNDQGAYLPSSAESTEVNEQAKLFYDSEDIPAVIVFAADNGSLSQEELESIAKISQSISSLDGVVEVSPPIPSEDGAAVQIFVPINTNTDIAETVEGLSTSIKDQLPTGVSANVTGPAGLTADLTQAFGGIDGLLLAVALTAVLIILLVVYRSFLLPITVLTTSMFALCVALLVVWLLARANVFLLNGQTQGILFILVIGAATDYSLLYVSRYREELQQYDNKWEATKIAWKGTIEPVLASGGTVIAGLMCLLLSDLKSNSVLGPVASIGIVFAMLAALTFLPAILGLLGRKAFWPRTPKFDEGSVGKEHINFSGIWGKTVRFVQNHYRPIWMVTTVALIVGAFGSVGFKADGVAQTDLVLTASSARDGQEMLAKHFPGGSGSPTNILVSEDSLEQAISTITANEGVASVSVVAANSPSGQLPITSEGIGSVGIPGTSDISPTIVDGKLLLQATLADPADSDAAINTVKELRSELHENTPGTLVGGTTATTLDTNVASIHDRNLIIPIILIVILLILMLLLRAIIAPVLLILTTILSFGTAMGVSAVVFNHIFNFPGADPAVPLYSFVFLVALGIDYNIFLMTRVREESKKYGTHEGIIRGLAITGTVITSAGLVLAATFAALSVIPILFLVQLAFIVAFGVLLDTFIVRTLLVPSLSLDIGRFIWWPSSLSREKITDNGDQKPQ